MSLLIGHEPRKTAIVGVSITRTSASAAHRGIQVALVSENTMPTFEQLGRAARAVMKPIRGQQFVVGQQYSRSALEHALAETKVLAGRSPPGH